VRSQGTLEACAPTDFGAVTAMAAVFLASFIIWLRRRRDRRSGTLILLLYAATYFVLL
jgi:hypothetical protein